MPPKPGPESAAESQLRKFYDTTGWKPAASGETIDAALWEDLRPCAADYVSNCRKRILNYLPRTGDRFLDAASGPIQYPEYLEYSAGFAKRVCVDISKVALEEAQRKLGNRGETVCASILDLPFAESSFDAVLSLHTIYHIAAEDQERAVRQLIRVAKPGVDIVVVYSNPDRLSMRMRRLFGKAPVPQGPIYFHAYPLEWWSRFSDQAEVSIHPWRFLTAGESRRLVPAGALGRFLFGMLRRVEDWLPGFSVLFGAYPLIVLKKTG